MYCTFTRDQRDLWGWDGYLCIKESLCLLRFTCFSKAINYAHCAAGTCSVLSNPLGVVVLSQGEGYLNKYKDINHIAKVKLSQGLNFDQAAL